MECVSTLVTQNLEAMIQAARFDGIFSKRKAINTLLPYAIHLEQWGQQGMINAILRAARVSDSEASNIGKFMWHRVVLYISRLFDKRSPTSLNRVITLISPYVPWDGALNDTTSVSRWATAAMEIPYTDEVGQSVIDTLFQIASVNILRPHIPLDIWRWLKKQPPLPAIYHGQSKGGYENTVRYVDRLGDIDILKSYFLLLWTDRCALAPGSNGEVERSIRENFSGTGVKQHREDLINHLDHVLARLDQRLESFPDSADLKVAKKRYTKLKGALLEVERQ